jgi:methylmalonyl-CoA epimerase
MTLHHPLRIHHVAFAHRSGSALHDKLSALLGMEVRHREDVEGFVERMLPAGESYVQTLEVTGPGVVETFVAKRGNALHHVAFEVEDLEACLRELREAGVRLVDEHPRPGGMGTMIAFIHPSEFEGLLVELVEVPGEAASPQ